MFPIDRTINTLFSSNVDNPITYNAFYFASWLFNPVPCIFLLVLTGWLMYKTRGKREVFGFFSAIALAFIATWVLKFSFNITRPLHPLIPVFGPSFPSAHTAVATAYFLYLIYFLRWTQNKVRRAIHITFCIVCAVFVGVSRVYLGVHWFSDVVVGYVLGALCVYVAIQYVRKFIPNDVV